jgi:hypothetical protein
MMAALPTRATESDSPIQNAQELSSVRAGPAIEPAAFASVRRRALLEGCKWDPQVGDINTLSAFPLVMKSHTWDYLAACAESLTAESIAAEEEISRRHELLKVLGLPRALRSVLTAKTRLTPTAGRVMRFDFHPTTSGWQISEANSDVPGGFSEASYFTALIAEHFPELRPAGNPAMAWAETLAATAGDGGVVALLSAPGFMEDHQVIAFLAAKLRDCGCPAGLAKPEQISWHEGTAHLDTAWHRGPVNAIVRFYQAEWLSRLPARCEWKYFFRDGKTPVANPALAVISESKRFPLVWDRLSTRLPTWRALLPQTCDPRNAPWRRDSGWLLKTAMCNNGDTVSVRELMRPRDWLRTRWSARFFPGNWIAQRRFESVPLATPEGPRHVCVGVYTVNGKAAGAYARLSQKPLIDFAAVDVALLLEDDE